MLLIGKNKCLFRLFINSRLIYFITPTLIYYFLRIYIRQIRPYTLMKKNYVPLLLLAAGLIISACKKKDPTPQSTATTPDYNPGTGWTQVWSEEFNDNTLNTALWNYDTGAGGWGNGELEYYRSNNVKLANGTLVITAQKETYGSSSFTSGRINTKNNYSFKYGKIVGKIQLPQGYGMWPAFWMLGSSAAAWPACGEIDIMEMKGGSDATTYSTCHWADASNQHQYYGQGYTYTANLSQAFHYYEVEWDSTTITARFDGVQFNQTNITSTDVSELRNNSYFIILDLAVGGNFFSPAITNPVQVTASFPQSMYVDWIRVYQK
ncbi:MAG TPA: glycoside hydrolase family 16 protein [Cytophagaceae bacterium]|nr:glycoside hydrolase family 16 protein [Cytophagaceae bacterium]